MEESLNGYSIIRIIPTKKLITNCAINKMYDAVHQKKELEIAFPGYKFRVIPFIENLDQLFLDEFVKGVNYYIKSFSTKLQLTGFNMKPKKGRPYLIFNNSLIVYPEDVIL